LRFGYRGCKAKNQANIKEFLLARDRDLGKRYGVGYAEAFHYIGPGEARRVEDYVREHAVPLK
jgi:hypothetical protein